MNRRFGTHCADEIELLQLFRSAFGDESACCLQLHIAINERRIDVFNGLERRD